MAYDGQAIDIIVVQHNFRCSSVVFIYFLSFSGYINYGPSIHMPSAYGPHPASTCLSVCFCQPAASVCPSIYRYPPDCLWRHHLGVDTGQMAVQQSTQRFVFSKSNLRGILYYYWRSRIHAPGTKRTYTTPTGRWHLMGAIARIHCHRKQVYRSCTCPLVTCNPKSHGYIHAQCPYACFHRVQSVHIHFPSDAGRFNPSLTVNARIQAHWPHAGVVSFTVWWQQINNTLQIISLANIR